MGVGHQQVGSPGHAVQALRVEELGAARRFADCSICRWVRSRAARPWRWSPAAAAARARRATTQARRRGLGHGCTGSVGCGRGSVGAGSCGTGQKPSSASLAVPSTWRKPER